MATGSDILAKLKKLTSSEMESLGPRLQRPISLLRLTDDEKKWLTTIVEKYQNESKPDIDVQEYPGFG
jgi:hypothetical protein